MVKYIGLFMAALGIIMTGRYKSYSLRKSHSHLEAVTDLVEYISAQIEFCSAPLCDIYQTYGDERIADFLERLRKGGKMTEALDRQLLWLGDADMAVLAEFASTLGKLPRERQLRSCSHTAERLKANLKSTSAEIEKKTKLAETLSLLCAVFLLILFI